MTGRARGGFTLVEAMLAGAIAVLATLALMEGLVVAAKVSHENAELLAADAFAWDTAWRWLNKNNNDFDRDAAGCRAPDGAVANLASGDCPAIYRDDPRPTCRVKIWTCGGSGADGTNAPVRFGAAVETRRIDVEVAWGPASARRSLTRSVCRCDVGREGEP